MGRHHKRIEVSDVDRSELEGWLRAPSTPLGLATRARVIMMSGDGATVPEVMDALQLARTTVYKWRTRYERDGLDGLCDKPRSGRPRELDPEVAKRILRLTVERIPRESTHWSVRLMAKYAGVSPHHVQEVWRAADLKPHRLKSFKISRDPNFAEKVQDVVGLYMSPPDNTVVLSVDEKTQIQALDRTQPMLPLASGLPERRTHDYKRNGTRSLYAAFDIATGEVIGRVTKRHRAREFLAFLRQIDRRVPAELDLHLIVDNSSTHKTKEVEAWLAKHPRFHMHFTRRVGRGNFPPSLSQNRT